MQWPSETLYIGCAAVGGFVLSIQLLLLFFGGDIDADVDADVEVGDGMNLMSIRSISSFLTLFGLFGWWGSVAEWGPARTLGSALGAGLLIGLVVAWMMASFKRLQSQGNIDPSNAIGKPAKVYLRVPGEHSGKGKITVAIQGRSREFDAVTRGAELPTGTDVRVVDITTEDTFEVVALD